jgi:hypothetical protein
MAFQLPDTGQTKCYDNQVEIACPQPEEAFYGQDGIYIINPPSYTKLDEYGNPLPGSAPSWTMVRCNRTGLIWEVKTDDGSVHDRDNQYTWQQAKDVFIANLNAKWFGGFSDWRLPTVKELALLINRDSWNPTIDFNYFPNTVLGGSWYWSSTSCASGSTKAWAVWFRQGLVSPQNLKLYSLHVRAVRGEKISNSPEGLIDNANNTVLDTTTGLMWQQVAGSGTGVWENDLFYCENLELGAYNDWRLPNTKELVSIIDYEKYDPAINSDFFPGPATSFRSSTTILPDDLDEAWILMTQEGNLFPKRKNEWSNVRCVRGPILASPNSDFSANPTMGPAPLTVNFTDESIGDIESWEWDFGDGSPLSSEQNPTHIYQQIGNNTVSLTVSNSLTSDTETKTEYITVTEEEFPWVIFYPAFTIRKDKQ